MQHEVRTHYLLASLFITAAACGGGAGHETIDAASIAALAPGATYETTLDHPIELVLEPRFDIGRVWFSIGGEQMSAKTMFERLGMSLDRLPARMPLLPREPAAKSGAVSTSAAGLRITLNDAGDGICIAGGNGTSGTVNWLICCNADACTSCSSDTSATCG
jgi:hypothetical protein